MNIRGPFKQRALVNELKNREPWSMMLNQGVLVNELKTEDLGMKLKQRGLVNELKTTEALVNEIKTERPG